MDRLKQAFRLIFPNKCIICRKIIENEIEDYLCDKCYTSFHRLQTDLLVDKEKEFITHKQPSEELDLGYMEDYKTGRIAQVISLFPYRDEYRKSVLRWKYGGIRKYAKAYADLFVNDFNALERYDIEAIIPVPLAPSRKRKRGFNQALDLAAELGKLSGVPVYDCLIRNRNTKPQSKCTKEERSKNMKNVVEIKTDIQLPCVKRVAIIDDIYTTGATAKACITALQKLKQFRDTAFFLFIVCK